MLSLWKKRAARGPERRNHLPDSKETKKRLCDLNVNQNRLQWGRSNLVDPAGSPKIRSLNRDFGNIFSIFPRKNSKTQSSLNFV